MKKFGESKNTQHSGPFLNVIPEQQLTEPSAVLEGTALCLDWAIEGYICESQNYYDQRKNKYSLAIFFLPRK